MAGHATVLYFASLRDAAGIVSEEVAPEGNLHDLYQRLRDRHQFTWQSSQLRVAVDGAFATWDDPVRPGSEVAFIPPVSGG